MSRPESSAIEEIRIAAGCVSYDAWDVLPLAMANLAGQGIRDFYLIDHGSELPMAPSVEAAFDGVATVRWARKDSHPFYQGRMMTLLAQAAFADGFDVFIPFDSDEFWDCDDPGSTLVHEIMNWLADPGAGMLLVPEVDYVQRRDIQAFRWADLGTASYRALPSTGHPDAARGRVEAGGSYFLRSPSQKAILRRPSATALTTFSIAEGNHTVLRADGGDAVAASIVVRHLPFRSLTTTFKRAEHGRRRLAAGFSSNVGWQNAYISSLSTEQVEAFWGANSWDPGIAARTSPDLAGARIVPDDRLSAILARSRATGVREQLPDIAPDVRPTVFAGVLLDLAIDTDPTVVLSGDVAKEERDAAIAQRDTAIAERDAITRSTIWRATAWYRSLRDRFTPNPG